MASPTPTVFRKATVGDAVEIARLAAELGYPTEPDEMRMRLESLLADPAHHVVVASDGTGNLLGWVHAEHRLSLESGARAELMGLVVETSVLREGIGRSLVEIAEAWASECGLTKMIVRSNAARTASHPFYDALGYTREKTQHAYAKLLPHGDRIPTTGDEPKAKNGQNVRSP